MAKVPVRHVVVALDTTEASLRALKWAATEILRPGDVVHVVHVAKVLSPQVVIQHSQPGTSFTVPTTSSDDEASLNTIRHDLKTRYLTTLDALHIAHTLHLWMDTANAPASSIGDTIIKIADESSSELVVMSSHNKTTWEELFVGSVAEYCFNNCKRPLAIVRNYPVQMPAATPQSLAPVVDQP